MTKNLILGVALILAFVGMVQSSNAQSPSSALLEMVNALKQQQAQMATNQSSVDEKITSLAEEIRLARLYMSRGGGKHKALPIPKK